MTVCKKRGRRRIKRKITKIMMCDLAFNNLNKAANRAAASLVESESPVSEASPEGDDSPQTPETSMVFVDPLEHVLVSSVAERSIGRQFAVAELIVARLRNIELDWSAPGEDPLALTVAEGRVLRVAARAPVVNLASVQIDMGWEYTGVSRQRRRSVPPFFVGPGFSKLDDLLLGEVGDVVRCDLLSWSRRLRS